MVFATATALAAMRWRQDYYLFLIGAVAFTAATVGYLHRRRHRPGRHLPHRRDGASPTSPCSPRFHVDNGPHLPLWDHLPTRAFWLLPTAIGAPIVARSITRARRAGQAPRQLLRG